MQKLIYFIFLTYPFLSFYAQTDSTESLLKELDSVVADHNLYSAEKEKRIERLKNLLSYTSSNDLQYGIYENLFYEYSSYNSDSALLYANKNILIAGKTGQEDRIIKSNLHLASILGILGMYKESLDIINQIDIKKRPSLKGYYFHIYRIVYGSMADYSVPNLRISYYNDLADSYRDSLLSVHKPMTSDYVTVKSDQLIVNGLYDHALELLLSYYPKVTDDLHERAIMAYSISKAYSGKKKTELEKYWLAVSAINDIKTATKEYISLRDLAVLLYEEGDINRSYRYMKRSLEDALFCNARLRTLEISNMMPIIDKAYQHEVESRQKTMLISLLSICGLSILLIIAVSYIYLQMRRISTARAELADANLQLKELNSELTIINTKLKYTNEALHETNVIKEKFIGHYMAQCFVYLNKIDEYRRQLNRLAISGKVNEIFATIKSTKFIEKELKEFYNEFDHTFLQLFPTFIEEMGDLMTDNDELQLKHNEILNTGLRVFALIRLGIKDNEKISFFLRYSLSTIYNCKTKFRNKAKGVREEFENDVMKIGTKHKQ